MLKKVTAMRIISLTLVAILTLCRAASAQQAPMLIPGAGQVSFHISSFYSERFAHIVRQSTDYSCGAASVATILRYAYGLAATENGTIRGMLSISDPQVVKTHGFSLLDIKHYVDAIGFVGSGYRLPLASLYAIKVPSIALITVEGYSHFVVLKHADPDYVYIADPMFGNRRIETSAFAHSWDGIIFVIAANTYDIHNKLLALNQPLPLDVISNGIPSVSAALNNAQLMLVYIPAMNRL